jgi:hypothetical protein
MLAPELGVGVVRQQVGQHSTLVAGAVAQRHSQLGAFGEHALAVGPQAVS